MNPPKSREEELFFTALALPTAGRSSYLASACGDDDALRGRVELLLRAHEEARSFMETSPAAGVVETPARHTLQPEEKPGETIGRYKLLQKIGEGGCGVVYMAEQQEPVVRRVALKVIKLGMDTKEVIARFEAERQALALMNHPNIASVLDGGATEAGRPFFVMELVRGVPITKFCDEQNLPTAKRLELFTAVCHAVQHAHQKGIIHRDLKPSNILVTLHDGVPVPKVIDFGIAKATQGKLTDSTVFTAFEQFIGTPAYMSPEQAEMSGLDIDTRSDIYSLGVLLYELLTGRPPFDPKTLLAAGLDEIRRIIREVDPPRPSTRLATLTDADRSTVATQRGTAPAHLSVLLRGDLDWIVMRCLEKDRTRRYETPSALATDIVRHLDDEPVVARPPGTAYRLRKLVRRNRAICAASAAVFLVLVVGLTLSSWLLVKERKARQLAEAAEKGRATLQARIIELPRLFTRVFNLQEAGNLQEAERVLRQLLELEKKLLGPDDALVASSLTDLGGLLRKQGKPVEAGTAFHESLAIFSKLIRRDEHSVNIFDVRRAFSHLLELATDESRSEDPNAMMSSFLAEASDKPELRTNLLRVRVDFYARQWRWTEVTLDLGQIVDSSPEDVESAYWLAPLLVRANTLEKYRAHCGEMLSRFEKSTDASTLRRVSKAALLLPPGKAQLAAASAMADRAVALNANDRWGWFGKGLSEYRAGRFAVAVDWAERLLGSAENLKHRHVQSELLLALALHGMGREVEGHSSLTKARSRAEKTLPKQAKGQLPTEDWSNTIITDILMREADTLIEVPPTEATHLAK